MWKIKHSLFIYLSGYGSCHATFAKHDVTQEEDVMTFKISYSLLVQTLQN